MNTPILSLRGIDVEVGGIKRLSDLNLDVRFGEIHALVGEHRSGKSSVARLLGGALRKSRGIILINEKRVENLSPSAALKNGIGIIYQETQLIPSLNAVENIYAGRLKLGRFRTLNQKAMNREVAAFLETWNLKINLKAPVAALSKGDQYRVELLRAIFFDPDILIFDEISNKLNPEEIEVAYKLIGSMKEQGKGVLYISNNMNEIFEFADRVSVLKGGHIISTKDIRAVDKVNLIDLTYSFATTREELRRKNEELYKYKKYNEDIINNLPLGMIILDQDKEVYLINDPARLLLQKDKPSTDLGIESLFSPLPVELRIEILRKISHREQGAWKDVGFEESFLDITVFPFKDENYIFRGTILLLEDISKEYHYKNHLIRTERIASVAELAAGVAHEVNNPLGIIQNYVELLNLHQRDEYSSNKLNLMREELNRIRDIIGSLLSFAHLNETPFLEIDLNGLIEETLLLINHLLKARNVSLSWLPGPEAARVMGNRNRLKQVIINIAQNALEAMDDRGALVIQTVVSEEDGCVQAVFTNNGDPIAEEVLERIFNPFFTTKAEGKNTGLGLSICQHIMEAHGGTISCQSRPHSTVFTLSFPLYSSADE